MLVNQISVFLENKLGRLAEVTGILGESNIDISALSMADTTDFGILRLIVNQPELAEQKLRENGFTVSFTHVIAIAVPDSPGALSKALHVLDKESICIEYMYAFVGKTIDKALVILRIEDNEKGIKVLQDNGVQVLSSDQVYSL